MVDLLHHSYIVHCPLCEVYFTCTKVSVLVLQFLHIGRYTDMSCA